MAIPKIENQDSLSAVRGRLNEVVDAVNRNPWRGAWAADVIYREGDQVSAAGVSYVARQDNFNQAPSENPNFWAVYVGSGGEAKPETLTQKLITAALIG